MKSAEVISENSDKDKIYVVNVFMKILRKGKFFFMFKNEKSGEKEIRNVCLMNGIKKVLKKIKVCLMSVLFSQKNWFSFKFL